MPVIATGKLNLPDKQEPHSYLAGLPAKCVVPLLGPQLVSLLVSAGWIWEERDFCIIQTKSEIMPMDLALPGSFVQNEV